jgi:ADP-heptose:LPS heptosyltransferase
METKRLVVVKTRALGDTLLATPALRALRQGFPRAHITVVVSPAGQAVLEGNPDVDEVWVYDKGAGGWRSTLKFLRRLRRGRFDLGVALHASWRTAFLLRAAGIPQRVVHNHSGKNHFATIPILAPKVSKSAIERDLDAVRALGIVPRSLELELNPTAEGRAAVKQFLNTWHLKVGAYLVLVPGAGKQRKRWSAAAAAGFLQAMRAVTPAPWVILAGPQENELAAAVNRALEAPVPVFSGSLQAAAALLADSRGVLTTDSGPKHAAVAVRARTLTLWTDEPEGEWHPYALQQHALLRSPTGVVADITPAAAVAAFRRHFSRQGVPPRRPGSLPGRKGIKRK